ncbi:MAG: hypothetical protein JW955_08700 [Sedimentisphaerales bacterium]|nr:hypothetical protein [Sedimentisphaerales bacterium]
MEIRDHGSFIVARCWLLVLGCSLLTSAEPPASGPLTLLWQIGRADGDNAEFALAPGGYAQFKNDGFYVVSVAERLGVEKNGRIGFSVKV